MITIIGAGKVGGEAALFSALKKLDDQVLLLDIVKGLPQGEAMDINHMLSEQGIDVEVRGSNDYSDMRGSKIVVIVAGSGRKPGMTRMDLLKINAGIVKDVVENIKKHSSDSMIIPVTNPLDPMAYITYKVSGFERNRIFGMGGMLDLSRFMIHANRAELPRWIVALRRATGVVGTNQQPDDRSGWRYLARLWSPRYTRQLSALGHGHPNVPLSERSRFRPSITRTRQLRRLHWRRLLRCRKRCHHLAFRTMAIRNGLVANATRSLWYAGRVRATGLDEVSRYFGRAVQHDHGR